jgi:hypothetical protein
MRVDPDIKKNGRGLSDLVMKDVSAGGGAFGGRTHDVHDDERWRLAAPRNLEHNRCLPRI